MPDIRRRSMLSPGPGQPAKEGELMETVRSVENWSEYQLDDGTVIKVKPVTIEIWRVMGEYDNEVNPLYVVKAQPIMVVTSPDALKKKPV